MEAVSAQIIIFSLVQNFLLIFLIYSLLSLDIRSKKFYIFIIVLSVVQVLIRSLPVTSIVLTFLSILLYVIYLKISYDISLFSISIAVGIASFVYLIVEPVTVILLVNLLNIGMQAAFSNTVFRRSILVIIAFLMLLITWIVRRYKLEIPKHIGVDRFKDLQLIADEDIDLNREKKVAHTFYVVLLFLIIQGFFINAYIWGDKLNDIIGVNSFFTSPLFINSSIIIFNTILFFLVHYLITVLRMERDDIVKRIKEKNALRLDWEKRTQMHDRNHHLSMLYILIQLNKIDKAKEYLKGMVGEIQTVDAIVKSGNQALNALIISKISMGKKAGVTIEITVNNTLKPMNIREWDLNRIIGNLLDNAIEAVEKIDGYGKVELIIDSEDTYNIIEVKTCGVVISEDIKAHIFDKGYTSKEECGHGLGLAICKDLIEDYHGDIKIKTDDDSVYTSFQTVLPVKQPC
ncbi:MAG: sensor histidine kinase [Halanaerobiales bacterium]